MLFTLFLAALPLLAVAVPQHPAAEYYRTAIPASQCNVNQLQCCNSVQPSNSEASAPLYGILDVVLQGLAVPIGVTCTPISVIGAGSGATCLSTPVCCEDNSFNGAVAVGCTPVVLGL